MTTNNECFQSYRKLYLNVSVLVASPSRFTSTAKLFIHLQEEVHKLIVKIKGSNKDLNETLKTKISGLFQVSPLQYRNDHR